MACGLLIDWNVTLVRIMTLFGVSWILLMLTIYAVFPMEPKTKYVVIGMGFSGKGRSSDYKDPRIDMDQIIYTFTSDRYLIDVNPRVCAAKIICARLLLIISYVRSSMVPANKDHKQCWLSLVINSRSTDLASSLGTNGFVKY